MDPYFQQQKASEECRTMGGKPEQNLLIDFYHLRRSKRLHAKKMKQKNPQTFKKKKN